MKKLHRRCERRLRAIPIPRPFDLATFCRDVARRRGRPLVLQPTPGLADTAPCGMWLAIGDADHILYEAATSPVHAEHIILHELGHMLSEHTTSASTVGTVDGDLITRLMPDLHPHAIRHVLGRVSYTTEQEQEAELLASLIRIRAGLDRPGPVAGDDPIDEIADAFHYRPR